MCLKKEHLVEHILEIFIQKLIINFIKIAGREFKKFKEFEELKDIDKKNYCSDFYDVDLKRLNK